MRYKFRITKGRKRKRKRKKKGKGIRGNAAKGLVIFLVLGIKHTSNSNET